VPALRALISATAQRLLVDAFGPGTSLGIGLRADYERFKPVSDSAIEQARGLIYRVQALDPALRAEPDLLLDEALILKTGGPRALEAIPLLEEAHELAQTNASVASELGLLKAVLRRDPRGVELVRLALGIEPDEARHPYYLGRSLAVAAGCESAAPDARGLPEDAGATCAESLRAYRTALRLSTEDDVDPWGIPSLSASGSWAILHAYARRGMDDPNDTLGMSVDERIDVIEALLALGPERSSAGWWDKPELWLATLYEAQGDFGKATTLMGGLVSEGSPSSQPVEWLEIYARVLRESGLDADKLREIEEWIGRRRG